MKKLLLLALLALTPLALRATPTRLLTLDNMQQLVPDDWDATTYYSLSPHFKNHWYADSYANGKSFGWAFLDVYVGTLVLWYNKDFEGGASYSLAQAFNQPNIGLSSVAFGTDSLSVVEPREMRIQSPDTKLGLGYALEVTDSLNLALCFRLAQLNQVKDSDFADGAGAPQSLGTSSAYYTTAPGFGSMASVASVSKYGNSQNENAMLLSPQFSYQGDSLALDAKFDMFWPTVDNKHTEEVFNGSDRGSVQQALKDKGRMNWFIKPKLRYSLGPNSSLVLRGSYGKLDLSTEHRVQGSFTGTFIGNLANSYDLKDSDNEFGVDLWDAFFGMVKTWEKGKGLVVWGVGANGTTVKVLATSFQTRSGASAYDDTVRAVVNDVTDIKLAVPVLIGSELSLAPWCKVRGMVQRNFFTATSTKTISDTYLSDGTLGSRKNSSVSSDFGKDWAMNTGFGFNFGQFSWDTAMNLGFLANAGTVGFINPLYQSSFTYEF
jgi:hypothetical protein